MAGPACRACTSCPASRWWSWPSWHADKGTALVDLARVRGAEATLYLGDDVTDERAFEALDRTPVTSRSRSATETRPQPGGSTTSPTWSAILRLFVEARPQTA